MNELKMILMPIVTSELVRGEEGRERFGHALQCYQLWPFDGQILTSD